MAGAQTSDSGYGWSLFFFFFFFFSEDESLQFLSLLEQDSAESPEAELLASLTWAGGAGGAVVAGAVAGGADGCVVGVVFAGCTAPG